MKKFSILAAFLLALAGNVSSQTTKWAKQLAGTATNSQVESPMVHVDASGSIISAGSFRGTIDFNPGTGTTNFTAAPGSVNAYVQKLNASGALVWAKFFEGYGSYVTDIVTDVNGNIYVSGRYYLQMDADPGTGTTTLNISGPGTVNNFIIKLDASGNFVWAKSEPRYINPTGLGAQPNAAIELAVDKNNDLWAVNHINGGRMLTLTKYNSSGTVLYSGSLEAANNNSILDGNIAIDASGNILLTGAMWGMIDFDPGTGVHSMTNLSGFGSCSYIAKFNASAALQWVNLIEPEASSSSSNYTTNDASSDAAGNVYVGGIFHGKADFDPGPGLHIDSFMVGATSMFVLKLTSAGDFAWVRTWDSQNSGNFLNSISADTLGNVYATGEFTGLMDFNRGSTPANTLIAGSPDQAFVLMLTPTGSLSWVKQMGLMGTYTAQGTSVALRSPNEVIAAGLFTDSMHVDFWPVPALPLRTKATCKDVYIVSLSTCPGFMDTSVVKTGTMLSANLASATYQWKDCNTGANIAGATSQSFTPTVNGSYRVVITSGDCADSSACFTISGVSVPEQPLIKQVKMYPNPTTGQVTIDLGRMYEQVKVEITTAVGQVMQADTYKQVQEINTNIEGPAEVYFIRLGVNGDQHINLRLLKQ